LEPSKRDEVKKSIGSLKTEEARLERNLDQTVSELNQRFKEEKELKNKLQETEKVLQKQRKKAKQRLPQPDKVEPEN